MWKVAIALSLGLAVSAPPSQASSLDEDPFAFDAGFHGGVPYIDRFGGDDADTKDQHGRKLVRLANGDVVVAGLVQAIGATQNQANGSFNLGLVRYNADGQRVAWGNASEPYTDPNKRYLVYPNTTTASYRAIADIKEHNGRIYVAVKSYPSHYTALVIVGADGSPPYLEFHLTDTGNGDPGAGMVFYRDGAGGADKLILANTVNGSGTSWVRLQRFTLTSVAPFVQPDATFGNAGVVDRLVPGCVDPADNAIGCATTLRGIAASYGAAGTPTSGAKPKIYIAGDYRRFHHSPLDWNPMVMKVDVGGVLQTGYGGTGIAKIPFDVSGGTTQDDFARGIALETRLEMVGQLLLAKDYVYVAAEVDKKCHAGIGVAALDDSGQLRADFGDGGKRVFGGSNGPFCPLGVRDTPRALARNGDRLAVAGSSTQYCPGICLEGAMDDPMLAIVRTSDGALTEWRDHPVRAGDGTRLGGGQFSDVVAAADGTFTAAGSVRDAGNDRRHMLQTVRLRSDRVFGDGFEQRQP